MRSPPTLVECLDAELAGDEAESLPEDARDARGNVNGRARTKRARALLTALRIVDAFTAFEAAGRILAAARLAGEGGVAAAGFQIVAQVGALVGAEIIPDVTGADPDEALTIETEFPSAALDIATTTVLGVGLHVEAGPVATFLVLVTPTTAFRLENAFLAALLLVSLAFLLFLLLFLAISSKHAELAERAAEGQASQCLTNAAASRALGERTKQIIKAIAVQRHFSLNSTNE